MRGIDIAKWNPVSDYSQVARQIDFAVLKIINKQNAEDGLFATHLAGCRKNNIPIYGVYNYSYAETVNKAILDASAVIATLKKYNLKTIVWIDIEENDIAKRIGGPGLAKLLSAYKKTIEEAGYTFGIYTGLSYYNSFVKPYFFERCPYWIARYPVSSTYSIKDNPPESKKPSVADLVAWQYTSKGRLSGISGNVDFDEVYVAYEEMQKYSEPLDPTYKPILRKGDRNEYVRSWQALLNANGYICGDTDAWFGDKTEKALIKWQQDHGMEAGYIGPQTWATLP